ncbi:MAG: hypothetical protein R2695_00320 [Acidimicrobiales bacterium]
MSEMPGYGDPKYVDVWADDVVTLSLQYSTQWDSLAHVGAEFDADGDGIDEAVYYNALGRDRPRGAGRRRAGDGCGHRSFAHHLELEHMAFHGVRGPGRARRPRPLPRPRVARSRPGHAGGDPRYRPVSVIEPGDMLLLRTGFATKVLEWNKDPDPVAIYHLPVPRCRDARCSTGSPSRRSRH